MLRHSFIDFKLFGFRFKVICLIASSFGSPNMHFKLRVRYGWWIPYGVALNFFYPVIINFRFSMSNHSLRFHFWHFDVASSKVY